MNNKLFFALFFLFAISFNHKAASFGPQPNSEVTQGTLTLTSENNNAIKAPLLSTQVDMNISGLVARVKVTQTFTNTEEVWVEGKYLFPLPEKAAVDRLTIKIGERLIVGEIKEKQQAKNIYQKAKSQGKKASLVVQKRPNLFQNSIANIAPLETISVTIEYLQDVHFDANLGFSIRFPMTVTERYTPAIIIEDTFTLSANGYSDSTSEQTINAPYINDNSQRTNPVNINIHLNAGFELNKIESNTHSINHHQLEKTEYKIEFSTKDNISDRDFVLNWQPQASNKPKAALFTETKSNLEQNDEHFVSLMVIPPAQEFTQQNRLPRETLFVIDTSGSMGGESIRQAKNALLYGLTRLENQDNFNVIAFNHKPYPLFNSSMPASAYNLNQAKAFVSELEADGGTEMLKAMDMALSTAKSDLNNQQLSQILFLTDGAISNESALFKVIKNKLNNARLFTIGIGSAPNSFFMKRAAQYGKGTFTYIADLNQAEIKMRELLNTIERPQLTHINIDWPNQADMWPQKTLDLYAGKPLWIKAKVNELKGKVKISGRLTNALWQTKIDLSQGKKHLGIASLWAREKIKGIMDNAKHGKVDEHDKQTIISTALSHHLVSRFTSLVAVDKTPVRFNETLYSKKVPQHKPKGSKARDLQLAAFPNTGLNLDQLTQQSLVLLFLGLLGLLSLRLFFK